MSLGLRRSASVTLALIFFLETTVFAQIRMYGRRVILPERELTPLTFTPVLPGVAGAPSAPPAASAIASAGFTGVTAPPTLPPPPPPPMHPAERVSIGDLEEEGDDQTNAASVSADGRFVAFESEAENLVAGDVNGYRDVFVHDLQTGTTTAVSVSSGGVFGNDISEDPDIDADGSFIAFESKADNLVAGDDNDEEDVFVLDVAAGVLTIVSRSTSGELGDDDSSDPSISDDGRCVAFETEAENFDPTDTNEDDDIYVHDRQTGETTRVSVSTTGVEGNDDSEEPSISGNGRYVAFETEADNLVPNDTNDDEDILVHDRDT